MRVKNNNNGYALLWTVVALMLGTIFVAGALQLAGAMTQRSISQNNRSQAYYTALSVVDTVIAQISGPLDESTPNGVAAIAMLKKLQKDGKVRVTSIKGLPSEMGSCAVEIIQKGLQLQITATASHAGESYTLTGVMGGTIVTQPNVPAIGTPGVGLGSIGGFVGGGNSSNGGFTTDPNTPIYIWDPSENTVFLSTGIKIQHMGTIYSKGSLELRDNGQRSHVHGEVVCDGDITIAPPNDNNDSTFSVGGVKGRCCDNTSPSFVYTQGKLEISGSGIVTGDVTADTIIMNKGAQIIGNVNANKIVINDSQSKARITGNVRAKEITMYNDAQIEGNVTADTVEMLGAWRNNRITGSINANSLTMATGAHVTGNVTVDTLSMAGSSEIDGNVTANTATGSGNTVISKSLTYFQNAFFGAVGSGVVQLTSPVNPGGIDPSDPSVGPQGSRVPDRVDPPMVTLPDAPKLTAGNEVVIKAGANDKPRVYSVDKDTAIKKLNIKGDSPVLLIVEDGTKLTIDEMSPPSDRNKPNLFIQLGAGSELEIGVSGKGWKQDNKFYLYAWGAPGQGAFVTVNRWVSLYGGINVDRLEHEKNGVGETEFHWKDTGDLGWLAGLADGTPPADPEDPPDPDNPTEPSEDDEIVWEHSGYAGN